MLLLNTIAAFQTRAHRGVALASVPSSNSCDYIARLMRGVVRDKPEMAFGGRPLHLFGPDGIDRISFTSLSSPTRA